MAILSMYKVRVFGLNSKRKQILEELQKSEIVQIIEPGEETEGLAKHETTRTLNKINQYMNACQSALQILDDHAPEKTGFFASRRELPISQYSMNTADNEGAYKSASDVIELSDKIHEHRENIRRIDAKQIALAPFVALDVPMEITETRHSEIKEGTYAGLLTSADIDAALLSAGAERVHYEILNASKELSSIWMVYHKDEAEKMQKVFQALSISEPAFSLSHHVPKKKTEVLEDAKGKLEKEVESKIREIQKLEKNRREIELLYDHLALRKQKYLELSKVGVMEHTFMFDGYVPRKYAEKIKDTLEIEHSAFVELSEPEEGEAPVVLQNNGFARPVEGITKTYSMPGARDIDPNPIMAFFYYFFFGMMFSDAGYGLILVVACAILGYGKVLEPGKRQTFRMFFFCGISTMFWGLMYGGFFGDATYTISSVFFGGDATLRPLWVDPTQEPLLLLIFSVILGLIQLLIGMGIKVYTLIRDKNVFEAITDHIIWMWILGCIMVLAIGMYISTGGGSVPAAVNTFGLWALIIGLIGLVALKTAAGIRKKKNPLAALFGGIISIYDITGFIGDMLSYSRLLALGLATGVIANVINLLGSLLGPTPVGVIFFIIVFILGHIVNFAINALGAYVHTMRLQYVEFYSKFYDGGGKAFEPFVMDTKYYRFSKE